LTDDELQCLTAMVDCLIPADPPGPSASQAGVVDYIEGQLSGSYGAGGGTYLGHSDAAACDVGDSLPLRLSEFYGDGLAALNQLSFLRTGQVFAASDPDNRRTLLTAIDAGEVGELWLKQFFNQVLENTIEGYFSDPIHGGNRDGISWKMLGFPGCGHDYRAFVGKNLPVSDIVPLRTIAMLRKAV
jgi:gluconate 2-dehydrogenase gamma chain